MSCKLVYTLLPGIVNRVSVCYISFFKLIEFLTKGIILWQKNLYWLFKSSPSARLYLAMLARLNFDSQCALIVSYVIFPFVFSFALCFLIVKSDLVISRMPYLSHWSLLSWKVDKLIDAFYLSFCCTILPGILNILIFIIGLFQLFVFVSYI